MTRRGEEWQGVTRRAPRTDEDIDERDDAADHHGEEHHVAVEEIARLLGLPPCHGGACGCVDLWVSEQAAAWWQQRRGGSGVESQRSRGRERRTHGAS